MWRLSIFSDTFWGILDFLALFLQTMFTPDSFDKRWRRKPTNNNGDGGSGGGGGGGPRRLGRINNQDAVKMKPPMGGG